jgi:hypothetical protein
MRSRASGSAIVEQSVDECRQNGLCLIDRPFFYAPGGRVIDKLKKRALFREVNAQIREINDSLWPADGALELLCECGNEDCSERVEVAPAVYARARGDDSAFLVVPGHEEPDRDTVRSEGPRYRMIAVRQARPRRAARLVPATDPLAG